MARAALKLVYCSTCNSSGDACYGSGLMGETDCCLIKSYLKRVVKLMMVVEIVRSSRYNQWKSGEIDSFFIEYKKILIALPNFTVQYFLY